jgi:oxygen-dependent protoporphyrinogen oxidase
MKVLIIGGGITGLSAAWFLHKKHPQAHITLLEQQNRLGGWIQTTRENGFLFEKGPRTFQLGRSPHLLALLQDLNLPILSAPPQTRYLYTNGRLRSAGSFLPRLIPALLRELFVRPSTKDESIYDFAARRFSPRIAETLFDPITLGIYAGDIRKLSIRSCFPALHNWEQTHGSVLRGLFQGPKKAKGLFTLPNGMSTLVEALQAQLPIEFVLNCTVTSIHPTHVIADDKIWDADQIISALPPQLPSRSLWVVNLVYATDVLRKKGYGYLVPTKEKESLLGAIFDSCIFPQQNSGHETRLTAMLRAEEPQPLEAALDALQRHLHITAEPIHASVHCAQNAIPQYEVGCNQIAQISVDACIERAHKMIQEL